MPACDLFVGVCGARFEGVASVDSSELPFASVAQLVEQLICNQPVVSSNPSAGSRSASGCGVQLG